MRNWVQTPTLTYNESQTRNSSVGEERGVDPRSSSSSNLAETISLKFTSETLSYGEKVDNNRGKHSRPLMRAYGCVPLTCMHTRMYHLYTNLSESKKRKAMWKRELEFSSYWKVLSVCRRWRSPGKCWTFGRTVLVRVSIAVKRHHDYGNSYQGNI